MFRLYLFLRSLFQKRPKPMTLEELIQQANEAKDSHNAALAATDAAVAADAAVETAVKTAQIKRAEEVTAYQEAAKQLQEALDATLAYAQQKS